MTALLFDAGNTRLKWAEYDQGELGPASSIGLAKLRERGLNTLTSKLPIHVDDILVSNVAGATLGARLSGVLGAHCNCEVRFAHSEAERSGLVNAYSEPRQMGVDRWVAMLGAWTALQGACVVVDAGTATTIDAIDPDGHHLGGQILPGVSLMLDALGSRTSSLPNLADDPGNAPYGESLFGAATIPAIRAGAWAAVTGAIQLAVRELRDRGTAPRLVLTGGDALRMLDALPDDTLYRPQLVLEGLATLLDNRS